jgi:methionine-rich copper-binding protein CopC
VLKKLIAVLVALTVCAPGAFAATSHFVKVSPSKVAAGKTVTVSGSVDHGCQIGHKGDSATIISKGFKGATKTNFAGVPSVSASLASSKDGSFSIKVKLAKNLKAGNYSVTGRCGGGNFGGTTFKVTDTGSTNGLPGAY